MKSFEISPKIIYGILVLVLVIPLLKPMGLPIPIMQGSKILYDAINQLQPGQTALISLDWAVEQSIELLPQARIVLQHLFQRPGIKIVMVSFFEQGPVFAQQILSAIDLGDKQYGKDYVNLGFIPGGEAALAGFARDPANFVKADFNGTPTANIEVLKGITSVKSFNLVVCTDSGIPGAAQWVAQVQVPYGVKMACLGTLGTLTMAAPYVQSKQIFALMGGVRGAAEYETIIRKPGVSAASMDAQSIGHVYVLLLIVLGNMAGYLKKRESAN